MKDTDKEEQLGITFDEVIAEWREVPARYTTYSAGLPKLTEDEKHLGCSAYPNCDEGQGGCRCYDEDVEPIGHRD